MGGGRYAVHGTRYGAVRVDGCLRERRPIDDTRTSNQHPAMEPLRLFEAIPGTWSLILSESHVVAMFDAVEKLGHTPNGYFWEGVAKTIVHQSAPDLEEVVDYDSEAGMFCACATSEEPLARLGELMAPIVASAKRLRKVVESANPLDFDD